MSSSLKCGTTLTEVALAIREFFLVEKRVEAVCDVVVDYSSSPMIDAVQLPPQKESNAVVAQRKSIRLISERPTFRNCPTVPIFLPSVMAARRSPKPVVRVRVSWGMPSF